jgi:hypothetical protein
VPWESRRNGTKYYYKPVRIGGKPRHMYMGRGAAGRYHECRDRMERRRRARLQENFRSTLAELAEGARGWRECMTLLRPLVAAHMTLAGYYNHRGEWRRRMSDPRQRQHRTPSSASSRDLYGELQNLTARVDAGEIGAKQELARLLADHPDVYRKFGDLAEISKVATLNRLTEGDSALLTASLWNLDDWRRGQVGNAPTAIEDSLGELAVSAKLGVLHAEKAVRAYQGTTRISQMLKALDNAHRRLSETLMNLHRLQAARSYVPETRSPEPPADQPVRRTA